MSMPHLNFLDIKGWGFKSFKKVSNKKLKLKSKIEDCGKVLLESSIFNLRLSFKFETFFETFETPNPRCPRMIKDSSIFSTIFNLRFEARFKFD